MALSEGVATVPTLPVTVLDVQLGSGGLWWVTLEFADRTTHRYCVPASLVTAQAVTVSALALAVLSDPDLATSYAPHRKHRRWLERT